jgi:hypothetical protein
VTVGLAQALSNVPSALPAIAGGIAIASPDLQFGLERFPAEPEAWARAPVDWAVFSILQSFLGDPYLPPVDESNPLIEPVSRDDGQPIGRLGISAYRWMRIAEARAGPERSVAARWILERGSDEVQRAMRDSFHWQNLQAGLAPVEPELLLAGLIFLQGAQLFQEDIRGQARLFPTSELAVPLSQRQWQSRRVYWGSWTLPSTWAAHLPISMGSLATAGNAGWRDSATAP